MKIKSMFKSFTTIDLVLMALLAVANGVISIPLTYLNKMLTSFGTPIATSTIVGIYIIYGILAMYIIRKPGTAFITFMIGATMQSLLPNSYGMVAAFAAAICYAVAVETIFAMSRYKNWSIVSMIFASLGATIVWFPAAAYLFGYLKWDTSVLIVVLIVRCVSGIVLCGMLSKWLGDGLAAARLLNFFAISQVKKIKNNA